MLVASLLGSVLNFRPFLYFVNLNIAAIGAQPCILAHAELLKWSERTA